MTSPALPQHSRRWRAALAGGLTIATTLALSLAGTAGSAHAVTPAATSDPASLVNPIIGTSGYVDTFPGPDMPFGMVQWGPDTSPDRPAGGGYEYNDSKIAGYSLTHISGPGCGIGGDVPMLPVSGAVPTDPSSLTQPFSHTGEVARTGYYKATTGTGSTAVTTQLTDTLHSGLGVFTFPKNAQSHLVVKLAGSATTVDGTSATPIGNKQLVGSVTTGHFCGAGSAQENDYTLHFSVQFNQPFTVSTYGTSKNGGPAGAVLTFDTTSNANVYAKVGVSYTSDVNAQANLAAEIPAWSFGTVRDANTKAWNDLLGKIEIAGGSHDQQVQFYTAMYHALLHPNVFSDVNGQYMGFDNKVHTVASGHAQYANYSGWDIYRSQVQLMAMVAPHETSDSITSMLNQYDQMGQLPKWASNNGESYVMVGDPADPIIADAYAFGARDFDTNKALAAMIAEATQTNNVRPGQSTRDVYGYLPYDKSYGCCNFYGPTSTQLEYDSADYAIATFAKTLGNHTAYAQFAARAQDWQNTFNAGTGYVQAKLANGQWVPGFTPGTGTGMVEGTSSQYTPMVPFNIKGLAAARGGNTEYGKFLDSLFTSIDQPGPTNADLSNEPSVEIPWEYNYIGMPWKTQQVVREAQQKLYFNKPVGSFGNDDLGAMSSWYVWSNLGLYPETPGTDTLVTGSPTFPLAQVHLANGKDLTITAPKAAPNAPYVQSMTVNGKAWTKPWTRYSSLQNGPTINFALGTTPNTSWGTDAASAPPSDATGQNPVFTAVNPASVIVNPGKTGTANVTVRNISSTARKIKWTATPQDGLTVSPSSGTISVAANSTATVPVTITAASTAEGRYSVTFAFTMGQAGLPSSSVQVNVAKPGEIWPYYTNAGITDDSNTDAATFDGQGWSFSAQALAAQKVTPGSMLTVGKVHYTWPDVPVATLDNIEMAGQTIPLAVPAGSTTIGLLGSGSNADATVGAGGTATVHYTDGSTSTLTARFSDWTLGAGSNQPVSGNTVAVQTAYRNASGNQKDNVKTYVFSVTGALTAGKTVASITLPQSQAGTGHVWAIGFDGTMAANTQARVAIPHLGQPAKQPAPGHITMQDSPRPQAG